MKDHTPPGRRGDSPADMRAVLLDPASRPDLDRLARLAAALLDVPVAQVNTIVDGHQQTLGSAGPEPWLSTRELPLEHSYCRHVLDSGEALTIDDVRQYPDARQHPDARNPIQPEIAAYAGVPIAAAGGPAVASLCAIAFEPRSWSDEDVGRLRDLAVSVLAELELRRARSELASSAADHAARLRESEERFRLMVGGSEPVFFYEHDAEGRFTYLSPSVRQVLGYAPEELIGISYEALLTGDPSDAHVHDSTQRALETGEPGETYTAVVRTRSGKDVVLELSERPAVQGEDALGVQGFARDVTRRKRVEEERARLLVRERLARADAEAARQQVSTILESITDSFFALDRELRFTYVNRNAESFFGRRREDLLGRRMLDVFPQLRDGPFHRQYERVLAEGVPVTLEAESRIQPWGWLEEHAYPSEDGLSVFSQDVSERRRAEALLRESEERYRQLFEHDLTGNFISSPEGRLLACNGAFAAIFGFESVEEALETGIMPIHGDRDSGERFLRLVRAQGRVDGLETEQRRMDGAPVHVVVNAYGVFSDSGELVEVRGHVMDVSESVRLEEQLRQAQKMEAVGRLAGGVAHDFNNVLTAIQGQAALALEDLQVGRAVTEHLREIQENAVRAATLTRQLLAFSRQQVVRPEVLDLNSVIGGLEAMLTRLIGEDAALETVLEQDLGRVSIDPGQFEQVIMNLVLNARDAIPHGGRITIESRNAVLSDEDGDRFVYPVRPGPYVLLAVSDTGTGLDQATLDRIFEPFFTTKEQGKGTGLGLATVYGIVKQNDGYIRVESEMGTGSTFEIYLPRVEATAVTEVKVRREAMGPPSSGGESAGSGTVLVVEDEAVVRSLIRKVLGRRGYTSIEAQNGREAIRVVEEHDGPIDLVLTDVVMPEMGGRELREHLARTHPELRVLFMSGYTEDEVVRRGITHAEVQFLEKPFTPEDLERKVREMLDGAEPG